MRTLGSRKAVLEYQANAGRRVHVPGYRNVSSVAEGLRHTDGQAVGLIDVLRGRTYCMQFRVYRRNHDIFHVLIAVAHRLPGNCISSVR